MKKKESINIFSIISGSMPLTGWLFWIVAFALAIMYRVLKDSIPRAIGVCLLITIALCIALGINAIQRSTSKGYKDKLRSRDLVADRRILNQMDDERNQMIINKSSSLTLSFVKAFGIFMMYLFAFLDAPVYTLLVVAAMEVAIPIVQIIAQSRLEKQN